MLASGVEVSVSVKASVRASRIVEHVHCTYGRSSFWMTGLFNQKLLDFQYLCFNILHYIVWAMGLLKRS